jgi:hypothetical protein
LKGSTAAKPPKPETKEEIHKRISKRFEMLGQFAEGTLTGAFRSLIVSGPPGLGKTYSIEAILKKYDPNEVNTTQFKGKITPASMAKILWDHREEGQIVVFDDTDNIFYDDVSLNLLKAACDTSKQRKVSYVTEKPLVSDKDGTVVDKRFDFNGTVIFLTNYDFDSMIESGHRLAPHFEALKSRSTYVTLGMKTRKDYMVRVEQIAEMGLFNGRGEGSKKDVLAFMNANLRQLDEISARMAVKIAGLRMAFPKDWQGMAAETCFRKDLEDKTFTAT